MVTWLSPGRKRWGKSASPIISHLVHSQLGICFSPGEFSTGLFRRFFMSLCRMWHVHWFHGCESLTQASCRSCAFLDVDFCLFLSCMFFSVLIFFSPRMVFVVSWTSVFIINTFSPLYRDLMKTFRPPASNMNELIVFSPFLGDASAVWMSAGCELCDTTDDVNVIIWMH